MQNRLPASPPEDVSTLRYPLGLRIGFWFCIVIAVAVVVRRVLALATPPNPNLPAQMADLDAAFASHAGLTLAHILSALALVAVLPLLFWRRTRTTPWVWRVYFALGAGVGVTAFAMSRFAEGGWVERTAVIFYDSLFLFALANTARLMRQGARLRAQRWVLRGVAILLGIATTRPVMGVFFATASRTHLTVQQFFGIAFWIGFSINAVVMEAWLRLGPLSRDADYSLDSARD